MTYSPFGYGVFGDTLFGQPPSVSVVSTLTVTPVGYSGLQINWTPPSGTFSQLILMRSAFGTPLSVFDNSGTILLSETAAEGFSVQFLDTGLQPGHFYYYSLFVASTASATPQYLLAGTAQGLVLTEWAFGDTFASWTPDWYLEQDLTLATDSQPDGPLVRFLNLLGYEMDWIRSEIESLFLLTNVELISGALLPAFGANYGVDYEPSLGMTRSRVLVQNAVFLYKNRGTQIGAESAGSAFSGYGCQVTTGKNQMIQLDDSAFDQSAGHWRPLNGTATITPIASSVNGVTPPHVAYLPMPTDPAAGIEGYLPQNNENIGQISGSGAVAAFSTCTPATSLLLGIPIVQQATPGPITFSQYFFPVSTLRSFFLQIDWYAINGALISSTIGSSIAEVSSTWTRAHVSGSPPAGAFTYGLTMQSTASLGADLHLTDAGQVESGLSATSWQPPRDIQLNLIPVRQNLITNTQGVTSTTGWAATGATIARSTAAVPWPAGANQGFLLTATGASAQASMTIPVNPGIAYSLSFYALPFSTLKSFTCAISWFTSGAVLISTVTSTPVAEVAGTFEQASVVNAVAPVNAASAHVQFNFLATTNGNAHYIGAPLFAPEAALLPFFDASFQPTTDYLWEGTPNLSVSDYYPTLPAKLSRLATIMEDYTPIGSTYSLFVGALALANINFVD